MKDFITVFICHPAHLRCDVLNTLYPNVVIKHLLMIFGTSESKHHCICKWLLFTRNGLVHVANKHVPLIINFMNQPFTSLLPLHLIVIDAYGITIHLIRFITYLPWYRFVL